MLVGVEDGPSKQLNWVPAAPPTRTATDAERELLRLMGGSCELALGALAMRSGDDVVLDASIDGRRARVRARDPMAAARNAAAELGALDAV